MPAPPPCNAACIKAILDAMLDVHHRTSRAWGAAQLGAAQLTVQDSVDFADAGRAMCKAADALSAAAGFPTLAPAGSPPAAEPTAHQPGAWLKDGA
jgi:hypothetical protein